MSKPKRKVEVEWEDSVLLHGGWNSINEAVDIEEVVMCMSVGYVIKDTKKGLILASGLHNDQVAGVTVIPKSAVRTITTL